MCGQLINVGYTSLIILIFNTHLEGSALDVNHLEGYAIHDVLTRDRIGSDVVILHTIDEAVGSSLQLAKVVHKN